MTPAEMKVLISRGLEALRAAKGLSGEEQQIVDQAIAGLEAAAAEEPVKEPEPKAKPEKQAAPPRKPIGRGSNRSKTSK